MLLNILFMVFGVFQLSSSLRIMQYNAEWFFLNEYNGCPGSSCSWANITEATLHLNSLAKVVETLNPDIVNFCEVEGLYELSQLNELLDNRYAPYLIPGTDTATGQNVGLLSKIVPAVELKRTTGTHSYPVSGSKCGYSGSGSTGVSKNYYTKYVFGTTVVHFIGVHLLAFPTDVSRCSAREAQASIIQELIVSLLAEPGSELILVGDMNDYDGEIRDLNNDIPTSMVLDILKGLKGVYAGKYELKSVAEIVLQEERYTDWWDKNGDCLSTLSEMTMIDHFLITPGLVEKVEKVSFQHLYGEMCGTYNSDHYPIVVDFLLEPTVPVKPPF
jgi:exonuclease III